MDGLSMCVWLGTTSSNQLAKAIKGTKSYTCNLFEGKGKGVCLVPATTQWFKCTTGIVLGFKMMGDYCTSRCQMVVCHQMIVAASQKCSGLTCHNPKWLL